MFALVKHAVPLMKRGSAIINTSSVTATKGSGGFSCVPLDLCHRLLPDADLPPPPASHDTRSDYAATKGAILSFTRSLGAPSLARHASPPAPRL